MQAERNPVQSRCAAPRRPSARGGFTILELLTVTGIISVLAGIVLPAVGSAREAARRLQCANQLKQIGLALQNYHDVYRSFPPGWQWESTRSSAYGWAVPVLPFLEHREIFNLVDRNRPLSDPVNSRARRTPIELLVCPSDIIEPTFTLYTGDEDAPGGLRALVELPTANYFGVFGTLEPDGDGTVKRPAGDGTFIESRSVRMAELLRGTSNTIVVGERTMGRVPSTWLGIERKSDDVHCRLVGNAFRSPNCRFCDECEFASRHHDGANFLWGDGRVTLVSENIDSGEYQRMARRTDF